MRPIDNQVGGGPQAAHPQRADGLPYPHAEIQLALGGELTSEVSASTSEPGRVNDLYITSEGGPSVSPPTPSPEPSPTAA